MGNAHTPDRYRGIIRPDDSLEFWDSESGTYTAAGARVGDIDGAAPCTGVAQPSQSTDMALRASGEQTDDMQVLCNRRGFPVLDGASYLWRAQDDTTDDRRGCDLPVPQAAWDPIDLSNSRYYFHIISTPDDYLVMACQDSAGATYVYSKAPGATSWSSATVENAAVPDGGPCLLVVPRVDGYRLMLYRWTGIASDYNVRAFYSDDQGATWTNDGEVLDSDIDVSVYATRGRLRAAYNNGQILLVGHIIAVDTGTDIERDRIVQWASSDGGGQFTRITISDGSDTANAGAYPDLCVWRGEFVLGRLTHDSSGGGVVGAFRRLASASYPWTAGTDVSDTSGLTSGQFWGVYVTGVAGVDQYITQGELALWSDDVLAIYAASRHSSGSSPGAHPIVRSADGADSWTVMGDHQAYPAPSNNGSVWWNAGGVGAFTSTSNELLTITGCHHRARGVIASSYRVAGGAPTHKSFAVYLGGWQSVPMPSLSSQAMRTTNRCAWDHNGAAYHLPSQSIWILATGPGSTETQLTGSVSQVTGVGGSVWNSYPPGNDVPQGMIGEYYLAVTSGTAFIEFINGNNAAVEYQIQVGITSTQVWLYDQNAVAILGTLAYTGPGVRVRLAVHGSSVVCWAMSIGGPGADQASSTLSDRLWTEVGRTATATNGGAALNSRIRFGVRASSEADWYEWPFSAGKYTGNSLYTQPDRLKFGRSLIEAPSWAGDGVKLSAVTGPAATGDLWLIDASADYPNAAMLPTVSPSPRHPYRSETFPSAPVTVTEARWSFTRGLTDSNSMGTRWGVLLDGMNLGGVEIYLYYSGAWNLAGTVGYWSFTGARTGNFIEVTSGGALNSAVIRRDELVGCLVEEITGGTVSAAQARIVANDPGYINTAAGASVPLRFECDNAVAFGNSPAIRIHPRRALLVLDLEALSQSFRGIQIRAPFNRPIVGAITAPSWPPEGYAEIATFAAGPLWAWGWSPSHGRRLSTAVDVELTEAEDGTQIPYQRKPAKRILDWSWAEGVPMREVLVEGDPDYMVAATGGDPMAFRHSAPIDVSDQLRSLKGALTPVVVCPRVDNGGSGRPDHWAAGAFLARITGTADIDGVQGDEEYDEQARVQALRFEEVI